MIAFLSLRGALGRSNLFSFLILFLSIQSHASGFSIFDRNSAPRAEALGGALTASADDAVSGVRNPAAWGRLRASEVHLGYSSLPEGMADGQLLGAVSVPWGTVGGMLMTRRFGDIAAYDSSGGKVSSLSASEQAFGLGTGKAVSPNLWMGGNLKTAALSIAGRTARATAADLGLLGRLGASWTAGATFRNLGSGGAFVTEKISLPRGWTAGLGHRFRGGVWRSLAEYESVSGQDARLRVGQEFWFMGSMALRAGWQSGYEGGRGFSLGMGLRQGRMSVDYALNLSDGVFGARHRLGLSWRFGGAAERLTEEGLRLHRLGRPAEAVLKFKEALDADPSHAEAVNGLRDAVKDLSGEKGTGR
jgi:hypothetical protein